jgi:hypothetical protein
VIQELFTDEFLAAHPVQIESTASGNVGDRVSLSPEEEQLVEDKLRGLGYL